MIDNSIINEILQWEESNELILKKDYDIDSLGSVVVAMANANGGKILIGVDNKRQVVGVPNSDFVLSDFQNFIFNKVHPRLPYNAETMEFGDKKLIILTVWEGSNKPYLLERNAYVFQGEAVVKANSSQLEQLFSLRGSHDCSWEREVPNSVEIQDIDMQRVRDILMSAKNKNTRLNDETEISFLEHQGLLCCGMPTNACVALFGKYPTQYLPQIRTRISLYANNEDNRNLLQTHMYDGNLFEQLEEVESYVKQLYSKQIIINGLQRTEASNLPLVAFREGLLNAMAHRDYRPISSFINIIVDKNKLSILNQGGLLPGLSTESLSIEHNSILRNPDIANIFYLSGFIEMAGSGTLRILSEIKKYRDINVVWKEENDILTLSFDGLSHSIADNSQIGKKIQLSNPSMQESLNQIVEFIKAHPGTHIADIAAYMDKSIASIKRYLMLLRENDMLETIGDSRKGGYKIVE